MSLDDLKKKRDELAKNNSDPILVEVFSVLLRQPDKVGPHASRLKPLDLSNSDHKQMFMSSVNSEVNRLKSRLVFTEHGKVDDALGEAIKLISK